MVPTCPVGSVNVDFEVEAEGSDEDSVDALRNSTTSLQSDLASGGLSLRIGGKSFEAPLQNVTIAMVDVTPAVNAAYVFQFKVI